MAEALGTVAVEESTYVVTVVFRDEDGNLVVPNAIKWTLTDETGDVVNSREDIAIAVPASSVDVVLQDDDLAVTELRTPRRTFTVEADYDSALGAGLPLKAAATFAVENLAAIS